MMDGLLITNIPHDCDPHEVRLWIESFGVCTTELKLISDQVTGTSPQFARVQLVLASTADDAARMLDGRRLRDRTVRVKALKFQDVVEPQRMKATP